MTFTGKLVHRRLSLCTLQSSSSLIKSPGNSGLYSTVRGKDKSQPARFLCSAIDSSSQTHPPQLKKAGQSKEPVSSPLIKPWSRYTQSSWRNGITTSRSYHALYSSLAVRSSLNNINSWACLRNSVSTRNSHSRHSRPVVAQVVEEIDIEKLREELHQEKKKSGNKTIGLQARIKQEVAAKCEEAIKNLSEEKKKQLNVIQLEYNFLYSEGYEILPLEEITNEQWLETLSINSKMARLKYYRFLQKKAYMLESSANEKEGKPKGPKTPTEIYEHGRIFMRIYKSTMMRGCTHKLATSMQFGIPLVFDMDFEDEMKAPDIRNTANQLMDVYAHNRADSGEPFHLHFLNCRHDNTINKLFQIFLQDLQDVMVTTSEQSYLDMFDKKDLIYLSPNGNRVMRQFDPNAVYIVGAFNDKSSGKAVTYAKAKEEGIRCYRLPLDEHLYWVTGRKDLTLDQVLRILQSVKNKQSWQEALKFVPQRKLFQRN